MTPSTLDEIAPPAVLLRDMSLGDSVAAATFLGEYGPVVLRAVRLRLSERLRGELESVDLVQAVWQSFFRDARRL